jgi:hypothetical protein
MTVTEKLQQIYNDWCLTLEHTKAVQTQFDALILPSINKNFLSSQVSEQYKQLERTRKQLEFALKGSIEEQELQLEIFEPIITKEYKL